MTAIELREELFREMNPLLDNDSAMKKILSYVKGLVVAENKKSAVAPRKGWAAAAKKAHAAGEDKLMIADVLEDERVPLSRGMPYNGP